MGLGGGHVVARAAAKIKMLGFTEKIGLVGGDQIHHRLQLIGIFALAQVGKIIGETMATQCLHTPGQAPDQQVLLGPLTG